MTRLRLIAYALLILGTVMDQVSTRIVLQLPRIYETNPFTVRLMSLGLWLPFDLILLAMSIAIPEAIVRRWGAITHGIIAYPALLGLFRLGFGFWNLHWLI